MSLKKYAFGKDERLKKKNEISRVFNDGIFLFEKHLSVVYLELESEESVIHKMGVSVPKKYFKRAVDRNLLKRRIRESFRLNKSILYSSCAKSCYMMFVYRTPVLVDYRVLCQEMQSLLKKMIQRNSPICL